MVTVSANTTEERKKIGAAEKKWLKSVTTDVATGDVPRAAFRIVRVGDEEKLVGYCSKDSHLDGMHPLAYSKIELHIPKSNYRIEGTSSYFIFSVGRDAFGVSRLVSRGHVWPCRDRAAPPPKAHFQPVGGPAYPRVVVSM